MNSSVPADDLAVFVHYLAFCIRRESRVLLDELGIRPSFYKADLLRFRLLRRRKAGSASNVSDFGLRQVTERKQCLRELLLCETEEKVGLVLLTISAAKQKPTAQRRIVPHSCIVARCDAIGSNTGGALNEMMKLDVVVAQNAGTRCLAS